MSMVVSQLIWLFRTRGIRKRAKADGKTFDESSEGIEWQSIGIDIETKFLKLFSTKSLPEEDFDAEIDNPDRITPKTVPNAVV